MALARMALPGWKLGGKYSVSKKDKFRKKDQSEADQGGPGESAILTRRGWKLVGLGVGVLIFGFIVLSFTDPRGQNFASSLSPFLIIGGYVIIGVGIVAKNP